MVLTHISCNDLNENSMCYSFVILLAIQRDMPKNIYRIYL